MAGKDNSSNGHGTDVPVPNTASVPKKLVLFFDGTGNTFTGSNADTNVVKLLSKLDRNTADQYHYYQTGIGTYDINEKSVNKTWLGEIGSSISQTLDQGIGMTFDAHVMAGYRFLMRYYDSGDKIYMFGFSRGAFTAKFLARMINTVGLLCKGNEEMVPFAFRLYQRYLAGEVEDFMSEQPTTTAKQPVANTETAHETQPLPSSNGNSATQNSDLNPNYGAAPGSNGSVSADGTQMVHHGYNWKRARDEITAFSSTFCRKEPSAHCDDESEEQNLKVFFLGLWDCVNSVAVLERKAPIPVPVKGTAQYVRHAVSVDERRVKFKVALLAQDIRSSSHHHEDIKEVWFPGNHGDVGGGWPAVKDDPRDRNDISKMTIWQRLSNFWTSRRAKAPSKNIERDPFQLSDIALAWMIHELELVGENEPPAALAWRPGLKWFKKRLSKEKEKAMNGVIHDPLSFGRGTGFIKVLFWKFMEWLPFITRWELENNVWTNVRFPLNKGSTRDIPRDAVFHEALVWRLKNDAGYQPKNNHGDKSPPCLKHKGELADLVPSSDVSAQASTDHKTYVFSKPGVVEGVTRS